MKTNKCIADYYSEKEIQMIKELGFLDLAIDTAGNLSELSMYRLMVQSVFIAGSAGPAVESLRRCMKAFVDCKPYRMTKEFDDLIQL